jgi:hypothetical protein
MPSKESAEDEAHAPEHEAVRRQLEEPGYFQAELARVAEEIEANYDPKGRLQPLDWALVAVFAIIIPAVVFFLAISQPQYAVG